MNKFKSTISTWLSQTRLLMHEIPSYMMVIFVLSIVLMNLFANKELINIEWLALDCGFLLSWITFLCMDTITKHFGGKASVIVSVIATLINLAVCGIFYIISLIPSNWGAYYEYSSDVANNAINMTLGGTWYVLLGSTVAFLCAAVVNSVINIGVSRLLKNKNSFKSFAVRSYVSTAIGQFVDNLIFALIVSHVFFGWSMRQVLMCSITGAVMELVGEVIFSPVGFMICNNWQKENIGHTYKSKFNIV